jgi:DNA-binding IclR family transcriptional regulator
MAAVGIQSLEAGARVLKAAAQFPRGAALKDIAQASELSASQAHRYLASWIRAGLMRQDAKSGAYCLAEGAIQIGLAALRADDSMHRAEQHLRTLVDTTGQTGMLAVWSEAGPVCVRWIRGNALVGTDAGLGSVFPLLGSAVGRVFAAHLPNRLVESLARKELSEEQNELGDERTLAALKKNQQTVSTNGYALSKGHLVRGINAIAAPVFDWQNQIASGLALILPKDLWEKQPDHWLEIVQRTAQLASTGALTSSQGDS